MASSSKSKHIDVNIDENIRKSCWKNRKNFFKYYEKEITEYARDDIDFNRIYKVITHTCIILVYLPQVTYQ